VSLDSDAWKKKKEGVERGSWVLDRGGECPISGLEKRGGKKQLRTVDRVKRGHCYWKTHSRPAIGVLYILVGGNRNVYTRNSSRESAHFQDFGEKNIGKGMEGGGIGVLREDSGGRQKGAKERPTTHTDVEIYIYIGAEGPEGRRGAGPRN